MKKKLVAMLGVAMMVALSVPAAMAAPAAIALASSSETSAMTGVFDVGKTLVMASEKKLGDNTGVASTSFDNQLMDKAKPSKAKHKAKAQKAASMSPGAAFASASASMIKIGLAVGAGTVLTGNQKLLAKYDGGAIPLMAG